MRVLFVTSPVITHILPTINLAHALRVAGHQVRYAAGGDLHAATEAGLHAVNIAPGVDYISAWMPDESEDPMHVENVGMDYLAAMFGRVGALEVDGALAAATSWTPDLIVHTALQGNGPLVASALGVPCVSVSLGPLDSDPGLGPLLRTELSDHYRRHRITGEPRREVRISTIPASFDSHLPGGARPKDEWPMRYVPYNGGGVLPDWLLRPAERPRIAVTLGTIGAMWGGITILGPLIAAAGQVDAEFVLTLGGGDVGLLGELPENVRVVEWMPLAPLLETCAGVIHHGGSGTIMTALSAGVPQCLIPRGAWQQINASAVVGRGIGFVADAASLGVAECRRLLGDGPVRESARQARDELSTMPAPAQLVPRLVDLAA